MELKQSMLAAAMVVAVSGGAQAATVQEVVADNLAQNPEVARAIQNYRAVTKEVDQAKAGYLPTVDATLGYGYEWTDKEEGIQDTELNRREARLNVNQMLFDGFATPSEVKRQEARMDSARSSAIDVAENYALQASRAYLELLRRDQLLKLAKETLYNHVNIYDQIKRRSESGLGTLASIQQAEGRLALAEVNTLAAENNLMDAKANYERVVGHPAPDDLEPMDSMFELPATLEEAQAVADENHPIVGVAQSDVEASYAQRDAAKSRMYPRLDLEVERRWDENIDGIEGDDEDLTAMLRLRYNLFNGGADKARIRQTEYQIGEAQQIQRDSMRQIKQSLALSWNANEILGRQIQHLEQHVLSSEETRNSYKKQFDIGQRSLLDLLDTENEVFSAKNQLAEAQLDQQIAQLRILNGMGQLLGAMDIVVPMDEEVVVAAETIEGDQPATTEEQMAPAEGEMETDSSAG
ncbi:TolC family outer membrane protein [Marinobacterium mangrovicola]|uniref:Adhesin transport system outer membrane protein n=1 Tax=Marinobacterium mangrovicola TaxID=1476959 RepID=A0A4R1GMC2_9GAMM|nr:TolC family outer membrane protein [Marinobacterium mangrovicola]TCK07389.1 adhesin transport system outer membrane protein [Marinobacterium mangrovicola]